MIRQIYAAVVAAVKALGDAFTALFVGDYDVDIDPELLEVLERLDDSLTNVVGRLWGAPRRAYA